MSRKRYKPEQIINLLTEALIANSVIIFGRSNVCPWLIREVPTTSAPRPVYLQQPTLKPHVCFPPDCFRSTPSSGRGRYPRKMTAFEHPAGIWKRKIERIAQIFGQGPIQ